MKYNLKKLEAQLLPYKLDETQKKVLKGIISFIDYPLSFDCCLTGKAGTGKTQLMKILVQVLKDNNIPYLVISPTNKSKNVIASVTNSEAITIHTLLSLQPNLNLLELDFKDLKFESKGDQVLDRRGVWIIDECSMINDTIYKLIIKKAREYDCKLVFLGDPEQLAPVKQTSQSKTFKSSTIFTLDTVYRQEYNTEKGVGLLLETLRKTPLRRFEEIHIPKQPALHVYNNPSTFLTNNLSLFMDSINLEDPSIVKLISYTNKRVETFNNVIRKQLFNNPTNRYIQGEILTGYDTCECSSITKERYKIENSVDYIVTECVEWGIIILSKHVLGWKLTLYNTLSSEYLKDIFVIEPSLNPPLLIPSLVSDIEKLRLQAIKTKSGRYWKDYFYITSQFLTPTDLLYQGRVIKRKTIDYGYCITVHKSQASQYDTVLIDMENILLCPREKELRQLQYVSLSRTRGDIHLYQK